MVQKKLDRLPIAQYIGILKTYFWKIKKNHSLISGKKLPRLASPQKAVHSNPEHFKKTSFKLRSGLQSVIILMKNSEQDLAVTLSV